MSAQSVRLVTAAGTINGTEDVIVFDSAIPINFNLGISYGDGRSFDLKNIGAGAVTLLPLSGDTIFAITEESSKIMYTGESAGIVDYQANHWLFKSFEFEVTPLSQGGTGIETAGVTHIFYVDGNRTDTYTADGSILRPFKTIVAAQNAVNAISVTLLDTVAHFELCKFVLNIAPGKYTDAVAITTARYIRWNMEGAEVSGSVTITQNQLGLSDYYGKVEFFGGLGNRAYRGNCGLFSGDIIFLKDAYDSLAYASFFGCSVAGNLSYGTAAADTHGTWVLCLINSYFPTSTKFISAYLVGATENVLIESYGYNKIVSHIAKQDGSATKIQLYDCNNTYFDLINTTPVENGIIKNCTFNSTTSIVAVKTLAVDANSYKSLMAQTPTLTGITISHLDNVGANPTPVGTRTAGTIVAADPVNNNIDALDSAIGFDAQLSGTPHVVIKGSSVFQAIDKLDTYKSVQTIKKTIGGVGVAGCDFNFITANDTDQQVIDIGALLPAKSRLVDIFTFTDNVFTGATTLLAEIGTTTASDELIASASIYAANAIIAAANAGAFISTPSATATSIYVGATPGANWSGVTAGKISIYVTYINVTNI